MKRLLAVMLTLLSCGAAYALPLGNPIEASLLCDGLFWEGNCVEFDLCNPCANWCDAWSFRFGYYGDFVFNRHLEVENGFTSGDDIEDTEIFTNAGYLALNFFDRFDIFATLGASNFGINSNAVSFAGPGSGDVNGRRIQIESETAFSWSVGARWTVLECGCFGFGVEGQYFRTNPDINRITVSKLVSIYPDATIESEYEEWQIGLGVSYRIWKLVPYFGAKYSHVDLSFTHTNLSLSVVTPVINILLADLDAKKHGGFVFGVSLVDCEKVAVTVEGRWPDENAVYVNGQIRF